MSIPLRNVTYHLIVLSIALTLTAGIIYILYVHSEKKALPPVTTLALPEYDRITTYTEGLTQQYAVQKTLERGDIMIFGSSELSYQGEEAPYRFFKNKLNKNILAFGFGGTQSLTILAQLSAYYSQAMIENGRVVVIISPGWFDDEGTHLDSFLHTMPASLLMRLLYESEAPYEYKKYIQEYIHDNFNELTFPKPIHFAWNYAFPRKETKVKYLNRVYALLAKVTQYYPYKLYDRYLKSTLPTQPVIAPSNNAHDASFHWDQLLSDAVRLQVSKATNNPYGITNDYFTTYVQNSIKKGKFPQTAPVISSYSKEYRDLLLLIEFCKMFKHKPLFVLLPFNPKAYTHLERYDPLMNNISSTLERAGIPLLNLWKEGDKPGMMADIMHTGAYGWQRINQAIYQHVVEE